jgi:NodT family efflux transporter outer membrane factor (OMF) lipoprotein
MKRVALALVLTGLLATAHAAPDTSTPASPGADVERRDTEALGRGAGATPAAWWTFLGDPELDRMAAVLETSSPDLAVAQARYAQARALTQSLRAGRMPVVSGALEARRAGGDDAAASGRRVDLGVAVDYELDLWGRVRTAVQAGALGEQAAAEDVRAVRLLLQAQLADLMLVVRGLDSEIALLERTETAYRRAAEMVTRRHGAGIASGLDVSRASALLATARSQLEQRQSDRALAVHAIAALVGQTATGFAIAVRDEPASMPRVPTRLPSDLLQRRPDIRAAQLRVEAAAATVQIARKAFFPSLTLSAEGLVRSGGLAALLDGPGLLWSIGTRLIADVFDGGRKRADVAWTQAVLEEEGQRYRATVLAAFQGVEDQLALSAGLTQAGHREQEASEALGRAVDIAERRYRAGAASYLEVTSAQADYLQAERNRLDLATRHRRSVVQLVRAIGGGWSETAAGAVR